MNSPLALSAVLLALAARPGGAAPGQEPRAAGPERMQTLASSFRALEQALEGGDLDAAAAAGERLGAASGDLAGLAAGEGGARVGDFAARGERLTRLAAEVVELAQQGDPTGTSEVLAALRATCVDCHLKHRPDRTAADSYPALGGTLTGSVTLTAVDGSAVEDRSGVVVFLEGEGLGGPFPAPCRRPVISQWGRQFTPSVLPVLRGTTVVFPNDDTIFHNVFSLSRANPFDLGIYPRGTAKSVTFERSGLVRAYCNIHPDMHSCILVLENPHFAATDSDGFFHIGGLPEGRFRLRVWHVLGGGGEQEVTIPADGLQRVTLAVREEMVSVPHKNKFGLPYRKKY